jgi:hypothetical protein
MKKIIITPTIFISNIYILKSRPWLKLYYFLMMFIVSSSTAQVMHDEVKTIQTRFEPPNNLTIINVKRFFNEYLKNEDEFSIKYSQMLDKGII